MTFFLVFIKKIKAARKKTNFDMNRNILIRDIIYFYGLNNNPMSRNASSGNSSSVSRAGVLGTGVGESVTTSNSGRALSGVSSTRAPQYPNSSSTSTSSNTTGLNLPIPRRAPNTNMSSIDQRNLNRQTGSTKRGGGAFSNNNPPREIDEDDVESVLQHIFHDKHNILKNNITKKLAIFESQGLVIVSEHLRNIKST